MKVKDNNLKVMVDVSCKDCPSKKCYWPRQDSGVFDPGIGYTTRLNAQGKIDWICGTREINGCPK